MESGKSIFSKLKRNIRIMDIVLIFSILILSGTLYYIQNVKSDVTKIEVTVSGKTFGIYHLSKDQKIRINDGTLLEISDGKYRLAESACKNKICVKMGWCSHQPIICVPQEILIEPVLTKSKQLITY